MSASVSIWWLLLLLHVVALQLAASSQRTQQQHLLLQQRYRFRSICTTGADLVTALMDPDVSSVQLLNSMALADSDWPASVIVLSRNFTIESASSAQPVLLDMAFVRRKASRSLSPSRPCLPDGYTYTYVRSFVSVVEYFKRPIAAKQ